MVKILHQLEAIWASGHLGLVYITQEIRGSNLKSTDHFGGKYDLTLFYAGPIFKVMLGGLHSAWWTQTAMA